MKKTIILIMGIILALILLSGCSKGKETANQVDLVNGKYVIAFSGGSKEKLINSFSILYEDGAVKEYPINSSIVIANSIRAGEELLFFSRQKNTHFSITNDGIEEISFLNDRYGEGAYFGVLFASKTKDYLFTGLNVGFSDRGYVSELLYRNYDEEEYRNLTFYDKILCSAINNNGTIYLQYLDLNKKGDNVFFRKSAIMEIQESKGEVIRDTILDDKYEGEPNRQLVLFGEDIILYRPEMDESAIPTGKSFMAAYSKGNIVEEKELKDFTIYGAYSYGDKLHLLDIAGEVLVFDLDYNLVDSYHLDDFEGWIRGVHFEEGNLYVALEDEDQDLTINHYQIEKGSLMERDAIPLPKAIEWDHESFTFLPLD
ncbi:hypothetical protein [Alkaliphilus hydrothermalis]|uniref:Lipoprotein n=1 Tax=Alkaliphilus hydrothermalis TaxID=1482730 RepID=A0ABS2NNG5_9FIRM|nr:hypothetical protein [Alkaliphilus hydrothermalis]MBM7614478.1 hypothetical protein [Alkaliphilus hydrothermalis]